MNTFYVDESGSMTKKDLNYYKNQYFVICIIAPKNKDRLKRAFKRFISSNIEELRRIDKKSNGAKMFDDNDKFKELKGSCLNSGFKRKFIDYFCRNELFEIYYIYCDNKKVMNYFYENTSRAFNYLLKLGIEYYTKQKYISKSDNYFFIDERNLRTDTKATLEEYLNTELVTGSHIHNSFSIEYCQSETRELIQLADVFSNIFYSNLISNQCYGDKIKHIVKTGYIKGIFKFPLK